MDNAGKLDIMTSSGTAELAAVLDDGRERERERVAEIALLHLLPQHAFHRVVIVTDSRSPLKPLLNAENPSSIVREVAHASRALEDAGC